MQSSTASDGSLKPKFPKWAVDYFRSSTDAHERLRLVLAISQRGIGVLQAMPKVVDAIALATDQIGSDQHAKDAEYAKKEAELAVREVESDFTVLNTLAIVALWSWLENFVKGYVALWFLHRPDSISASPVQKLKVELGKYIHLSKEEQADYLVELLEAGTPPELKRSGAGRFEWLLEPFSLSANPGPDHRKILLELQQIRHVVVHRNGIADRKLLAACPWVTATPGQPIEVKSEMIRQYFRVTSEYALEVFYRVGDVYGVDLRPEKVAD